MGKSSHRFMLVGVALCTSQSMAQPTHSVVAISGQPAPGTPAGVVFRTTGSSPPFGPPVINSHGRVSFVASLSGPGVVTPNSSGLWSNGGAGGALTLLARLNSAAPGAGAGAAYGSFVSTPLINDAGQTAVNTTVTMPGGTQYAVYSGSGGALGLVARSGAPAPDQGADFFQLLNVAFSDTGETAFQGFISAPSGESHWMGSPATPPAPQLLVRRGVGLNGAAGPRFGGVHAPGVVNGGGTAAFMGKLITFEHGVTAANDSAIFTGRPGTIGMPIREGMSPVNAPAGVSLAEIQPAAYGTTPTINNAGTVACYALLTGPGVTSTNDGALIVTEGSGVRIAVRETDPAPGAGEGVVFAPPATGFWPAVPLIDASGNIVFFSYITGPGIIGGNEQGIWVWRNGQVSLVARHGDHAPGTPAGVTFNSITSFSVAGDRRVLFAALLSGPGVTTANDQGLWAFDATGTLSKVAQEGDTLDVNPAPDVQDVRTIFRLGIAGNSTSQDGRACSINDAGQVAFSAWFTDSTAAVIVTSPPSQACPADLGVGGGIPGADGLLNNNDFIVFIDYFFAHNPLADRGVTGGIPGSDNAWDNNDFVVFIDQFFAGC